MSVLLVAFPGMEELGARVAALWPAELATLGWRHFPDGESLVTLEADCAGRELAFLCTLRDPDRLALPLMFAARTARELGARRVGLIAPYLGYLRQDHRFARGQAVSSVHFGAFLSWSFDWLVTVDPHLHRHATLSEVLSIPARAASAMPALAEWIRANVRDPVLIGPDGESAQWVEDLAARVGAPAQVLEKTRRGDRDVHVSMPDVERLRGRTPVLVDDIVSSGHTMLEPLKHLGALGLTEPVCAAVHAVFADDSDQALRAAGASRVVSGNTIPHATNAFDVSPAIVEAARALAG